MNLIVPLLIIGAGPFGLSMASYCQQVGIEYHLLGKPMEFWKSNMPKGMYLRSNHDWHFDPMGVDTIEAYMSAEQIVLEADTPISLEHYLNYAEWFQTKQKIVADHRKVEALTIQELPANPRFCARLSDGQIILAQNVLVATGYGACTYLPPELTSILPAKHLMHTSDFVNFDALEGKSCLIIGGRQSAFELAALASESGATTIHLSYRHETPTFRHTDWSWVNALLEQTETIHDWYRCLSIAERSLITQRLWQMGRYQLEEWLWVRIDKPSIHLWPRSNVISYKEMPDGRAIVELDNKSILTVDSVVLATGYKTDVIKLAFVRNGNLHRLLEVKDGYPVLDETFCSNIPGLYFTNRFASQDFGNFYDFTAGAKISSKIIGQALSQKLLQSRPFHDP